MNYLNQLAQVTESMTKMDFSKAPNIQCAKAIAAALEKHDINHKVAMKIAFSMKIEVKEFDIENPAWKKIVNNWAVLLVKLFDEVEEDIEIMLIMAPNFSLEYK